MRTTSGNLWSISKKYAYDTHTLMMMPQLQLTAHLKTAEQYM